MLNQIFIYIKMKNNHPHGCAGRYLVHLKSSTNSQKSHYLLLCFWNKLIFENVIVFNITNHHSQTKPKFNAPEINVYIFLSHFLYIKSFILNIFSHSILRTQKKNISKKKIH